MGTGWVVPLAPMVIPGSYDSKFSFDIFTVVISWAKMTTNKDWLIYRDCDEDKQMTVWKTHCKAPLVKVEETVVSNSSFQACSWSTPINSSSVFPCTFTVVSSPVPELSFLPTPYRGWTRAGERRVQDNLHAHAQNEPIKNYWSQPRCLRQCVAQCLFQLALWKKTLSLTLILS